MGSMEKDGWPCSKRKLRLQQRHYQRVCKSLKVNIFFVFICLGVIDLLAVVVAVVLVVVVVVVVFAVCFIVVVVGVDVVVVVAVPLV